MRPTVYDIAAEAGVSLATVDRVLNARPGVRQKTVDKVEAAVHRLGYVRDVSAANLAKRRIYPLVFIVPGGPNSFMRGLEAEIRAAMQRSAAERTSIRIETVPPFDPAAIVSVLDSLDPAEATGVALVATDTPEVTAAVDRLVEKGVHVATLVSDLPEVAADSFLRHRQPGCRADRWRLDRTVSRRPRRKGAGRGRIDETLGPHGPRFRICGSPESRVP
jgi:LacI family transcriptional regulator